MTDDEWIRRLKERKRQQQEQIDREREADETADEVYEEKIHGFWRALREELRAKVEQYNEGLERADQVTPSIDPNVEGPFTATKTGFPEGYLRVELDRARRTITGRYRFIEDQDRPAETYDVRYRIDARDGELVLVGPSGLVTEIAEAILTPYFERI
jgi:hypothetical protein